MTCIGGVLQKGFHRAMERSVFAVLFCVLTPLTKHREPDVFCIVSTAETIAPRLRPGQLVVLVDMRNATSAARRWRDNVFDA